MTPSAFWRTRKSSVPGRVQKENVNLCGYEPASQWLTAWAVKRQIKLSLGGMGSQSIPWFKQLRSWFPIPARSLSEQLGLLKGNVVPHDVIGGPAQFMGQGIVGHRGILLV